MLSETEKILVFFDEIGLGYRLTSLDDKTFLPGIKIELGELLIDLARLRYPGDLLHEAGHIAVTDESARPKLGGDMKHAGHKGGEEMAAIAWSWAALQKVGLPAECLFHPDGYRGASATLIEAFADKRGFGYPLLYSWFMCENPQHPDGYPKMQRWFRDEAYRKSRLAELADSA
ncbi:hypothetical protein [Shewanella cyperi]|uniref:hypothetical protein n=1 Tax=Shewanella cyperi TaxID=2814292 RepID=UPI001A93BFA9|nr:hypothetical protein [Shewanella cyperi]QSX40997.1 hypothetical protein JYB84_00650 [Shewanella cyperi]